MLGRTVGIKKGDIFDPPLDTKVLIELSNVGNPPLPFPNITPVLLRSILLRFNWLCSTAIRAEAIAI